MKGRRVIWRGDRYRVVERTDPFNQYPHFAVWDKKRQMCERRFRYISDDRREEVKESALEHAKELDKEKADGF